MVGPLITEQWLLDEQACENEFILAMKTWPGGTQLTEEVLVIAARLPVQIEWLAEHLLTDTALVLFNKQKPFYPSEVSKDEAWVRHQVVLARLLWSIGEGSGWKF